MKEMQETNGNAIILITHDLGVVADVADKIMVMYAGHPVEFGTADEIFYNPIHPYTWGLIRSIPKQVENEKEPLTPIHGNPPSLVNLPSGCPFSPRCPYATERCHKRCRRSTSPRPGTTPVVTSRATPRSWPRTRPRTRARAPRTPRPRREARPDGRREARAAAPR